MASESAPATRCSIAVRQGGKRVAFLNLDPATTLRELLAQLPAGVDAPALVDEAWRGPVPRDGSTCGAATLLAPDRIDVTLQALGWFPSGVLKLGENDAVARPAATPAASKPSALFAAVASRHDDADALAGNGIAGKVRTSQAEVAEDAARDAAAARIDAQRLKASTKRDAKTANLVWQIMAKRHASGRPALREEDRVYVVLARDDRVARYCFFSAHDTWGRARDALGGTGTLGRADGARASSNDTLGALRASGWLENFAVVRFVDGGASDYVASVSTATAAPPAAQSSTAGAYSAANVANGGAPDAAPPPAPPAGAYVVTFEGRAHHLALASSATVGELRDAAAGACGLPTCRLVYKGDLTKDPSKRLGETKLRPGAKVLVMRARPVEKRRIYQ